MLPAYAGMILLPFDDVTVLGGAPRVCGDDPPPRASDLRYGRVLPAYAGMIRGAAEAAPRE